MTKQDALDLAVQYHAFRAAVDSRDDNGTAVWGNMLLETQDRIGVAIVNEENTKSLISYARERLAA